MLCGIPFHIFTILLSSLVDHVDTYCFGSASQHPNCIYILNYLSLYQSIVIICMYKIIQGTVLQKLPCKIEFLICWCRHLPLFIWSKITMQCAGHCRLVYPSLMNSQRWEKAAPPLPNSHIAQMQWRTLSTKLHSYKTHQSLNNFWTALIQNKTVDGSGLNESVSNGNSSELHSNLWSWWGQTIIYIASRNYLTWLERYQSNFASAHCTL